MKILITGGAGFLGTRLARTLLARTEFLGAGPVQITLADIVKPADDLIQAPRVQVHTGALIDQCPVFARQQFDMIFHLAAAVSAECEADFDLGLRSNLDSTRCLLETVRAAGNCPRLVFASSIAVFGNDPGMPLPPVIRDNTLPTPQSSYGIQKFICEQLVADYTRRGFIDGRSARLMTVMVRPGRSNGAASGFLSAIVREPLNGHGVVCPVPPETAAAVSSPRRSVEGLLALAEANTTALDGRTAVNLPALTVKVSEILDALETIAGKDARNRVRFEPEPAIARLVSSWPAVFETNRATRFGLEPDPDIMSVIEQFMHDKHS